jgi:hypothetical protein
MGERCAIFLRYFDFLVLPPIEEKRNIRARQGMRSTLQLSQEKKKYASTDAVHLDMCRGPILLKQKTGTLNFYFVGGVVEDKQPVMQSKPQ